MNATLSPNPKPSMSYLHNPSESHYYYPIILGLVILISVLNFISILNNQTTSEQDTSHQDNLTIHSESHHIPIATRRAKRRLLLNFLIAYLLCKASLWSKLPYIYLFYYSVSKFSYFDISVLYVVDYLSGFVTASITGWLADKYGRKFMSSFYNILMPISVICRLSNVLVLAYIGQIANGTIYPILRTSFESWVICEAGKLLPNAEDKDKFLKGLFKTMIMYDGICSIVVTSIAAVLYTVHGIYTPFYFSLLCNLIAFVFIHFQWEENRSDEMESTSLSRAWREMLSKTDVLLVGFIEALTYGAQNIYFFLWSPYLISLVVNMQANLGFAFVCIVLTMISGTQLFEILVIQLDISYYIVLPFCIGIQLSLFVFAYFTSSYLLGLLAMGLINCSFGFYAPLNSTIKSKVIVEEYRAQIMSFFRLPLNVFVIVLLLLSKLFSPSMVN